jgi:hypothetical protein
LSAINGRRAPPTNNFRRLRLTLGAGLLLMALAAAAAFAQQSPRTPEPPVKIEIKARAIEAFDPRDPALQRFGDLVFRGGLELTSPYKNFGGLSSLRLAPDGAHFIAVSDKGRWLKGRIVYRDGRPVGIADAEMAPLLGQDGKPLAAHGWYDTESIADVGGTLYVGIERVNKIVRFDYGGDGLLARGRPIPVPPDFKTLSYNKSLECLVMAPKGMPLAGNLIAVTEHSLDERGNHRAFLLNGSNFKRFSVKFSDEFEVSDCAILPSATLLLLERKYSRRTGVAIRIRRLALASIKPGALLDGAVIFKADLAHQIDNMEGLAVHRDANGRIVLTMISDDNFSALQRTLLLQFTLVGE